MFLVADSQPLRESYVDQAHRFGLSNQATHRLVQYIDAVFNDHMCNVIIVPGIAMLTPREIYQLTLDGQQAARIITDVRGLQDLSYRPEGRFSVAFMNFIRSWYHGYRNYW